MTIDTFQHLPVASSENDADPALAADQSRQAGLSRVMDETKREGPQAEQAQRQHMVAELAEQREEGDHERTDAALAAAESEGLPPHPALPLAEPAPSGHIQHRWGLVRYTGWLVAGLAALGVVVGGSVLLMRRRRHLTR